MAFELVQMFAVFVHVNFQVLHAYFPFHITQQVVVDLLVGERKFQGKNPVDPYCGLFDAHL